MSRWAFSGVKVQTCVTSPPYFGLRDYGTAKWEGGSSECDHKVFLGGHGSASTKQVTSDGTQKYWAKGKCPQCGAIRVDEQIGLEQTPDEYVKNVVEVFRLVRDILADDGTVWLNLGDSYANTKVGNTNGTYGAVQQKSGVNDDTRVRTIPEGLKAKDLIGIPWRVAFALQADGWYLRQDIIWHKGNPMPESVRDRCTKSHEYIFLLSKSAKYYFNCDAIKTPLKDSNETTRKKKARFGGADKHEGYNTRIHSGREYFGTADGMANKRSVWSVNTKPYKGAHFATFPADLIEPCVLAGSRIGDTVLDPFMGSGTTAQVALKHGRHYLGCELNKEYQELQEKRIASIKGI